MGESSWYCPTGHMKTQQTSLMIVLSGGHGGEVLFMAAVVLHPNELHDFKPKCFGIVAVPVIKSYLS